MKKKSFLGILLSLALMLTMMPMVPMLSITASAVDYPFESFTFDIYGESQTQTGTNIKITGTFGGNDGLFAGFDSSVYSEETITIEALNGNIITNIEMTIGDYPEVAEYTTCTNGRFNLNNASKIGDTVKVENVNAASTTISTSNNDFLLYKTFKVYYTTPVSDVTLNPSAAQTITVGNSVSFTATVAPNDASDKTVKWSVNNSNVELYSDANCTQSVDANATDKMTVYAKGISAGSATVSVKSNADATKNASCNMTIATPYPLWVGGTQVTSANASNIDGENKASYDATSHTLTLNGYSYTGAGDDSNPAVIDCQDTSGDYDLTINLEGDNNITNTRNSGNAYGIRSDRPVIITGSGSLSCTAVDADTGYGISCPDLTVENGNVSAEGNAYGIEADPGNVTIKNGSVTATASGPLSRGIYARNCITISGGKVIATASGDDSCGIFAYNNDVVVGTSGVLKATGKKYGIFSGGSVTIDGDVEANGNDYGIFTSGEWKDVTINTGSTVTASGNTKAINASGKVKNFIAGSGWSNKAGTQGRAEIEANAEPGQKLSYKKVQFPAEPISAKPVLVAKGIVKGKKAVNISWNSVSGAAKYEVYFSRCNTSRKKYTPKFKDSTTGNSMKIKKLRKGRCYKFYVVAKDSKGNVISKSLVGHFIAGNVKGKRTNAKSLTLGANSVSLSKGTAYKITAKQKKVRKGKKLLNSGHSPLLRYRSDNPSVATVDGSGNIKAVDAGTCAVYVQTVNGIWKTVAVTVK